MTNQPAEVPTPRVDAMIQRADKIHIPEGHTFEYVRPKDARQLERENVALLEHVAVVERREEVARSLKEGWEKQHAALLSVIAEVAGMATRPEIGWKNAACLSIQMKRCLRAAIKSATEKA